MVLLLIFWKEGKGQRRERIIEGNGIKVVMVILLVVVNCFERVIEKFRLNSYGGILVKSCHHFFVFFW